ncbi:ABC transporter permease [Rhizobium paknamense]|uniref:ABC-2 type transport system permease protein n=1 Tax=Rhizobium paknamense TaxID=1206817 RepID=A0ABU0ID50_9HYPH|nr:ABC transporter permease [Rhizobium paknamense]MDQ0456167.1 ABC-2 type transport system permease protein [Rhizobium paknamense]
MARGFDVRTVLALLKKEIIGLARDRVLMAMVVYAFTLAIYTQATGLSHDLRNASIGVVDRDVSQLSTAILAGLLPPRFRTPVAIAPQQVDKVMDRGQLTFVLDIPENFQADVLAGRSPRLQLLIDATALMQAGIGAGYIQQIVAQEVASYGTRAGISTAQPVTVQTRFAFNQGLNSEWFSGTMGLINNITMLAILLAGAALVREREHGTLEHLLVMPVRPLEIMMSKLIANGLVILVMSLLAILLILGRLLGMPISGSLGLYAAGMVLYLFFATSLGLFLGTVSRSMPQMALLFILTALPMNILSGGFTPIESQPQWLQNAMQLSPSTHFVAFSQAILYRGAGFDVVWPQYAATFGIGLIFFLFSLSRFRSFIAAQQ